MKAFWTIIYGYLTITYIAMFYQLAIHHHVPTHTDIGFAILFSTMFFVDQLIERWNK